MLIQYISDLHLEFTNTLPEIPKLAPVLALLGDIGDPRTDTFQKFILEMGNKFDYVIFVAGNHEYYSDQYTCVETQTFLHNFFIPFENIYFLDNQSLIIDGVRFIGSTLWSKITQKDYIQNTINDYKYIQISPLNLTNDSKDNQQITPNFINLLHKTAVQYLESEISTDLQIPTIVLTHHVPLDLDDFIPFHSRLNEAFFSNQQDLLQPPIVAWLFGHCHTPIESVYNQIFLRSNPVGYPGENSEISDKVLEIIF